MVGVPQNFQSISPVIANYDFVDIAAGTGYINFYAGLTVDKKILSNFPFYSDLVTSSFTIVYIGFTQYYIAFDYDFDVVLNRPLDLQGLGIVNIPVALDSTSPHWMEVYATVILRKWDGSTETDIVSNDSRVFDSNDDAIRYNVLAVDLTVPLTHFKKGETLRLTIRLYGQPTDHDLPVKLAHDPMNRTTGGVSTDLWDASGAVPSKLIFQCPVRLNI